MAKTEGTKNDATKALGRMLNRDKFFPVSERRYKLEWTLAVLGIETVEQYLAVVQTGQDRTALDELAAQSGYVQSRIKADAAIQAGEVAAAEYSAAVALMAGVPAEASAPALAALRAAKGLDDNGRPVPVAGLIDDIRVDVAGKALPFLAQAEIVANETGKATESR